MRRLGIGNQKLPAWLDAACGLFADGPHRGSLVVAPALINAHDHLHLNRVPSLPQAGFFRNSYEWIEAFQAHFDAPEVKTALAIPKDGRLYHGAVKNMLCGATTVMHHDPWQDRFDDPDFPVKIVREFGWSHSLGLSGRRQYGPPIAESFAATPKTTPWFIHLAEGVDEVAGSELKALDQLGCLGSNTVIIHGTGIGDEDLTTIIERRAHVVWCPASNLHLFGRTISVPRLRRLFDASLLAIGSDSRLTGAWDLLDELRVARACSDFSAAELVALATTRNHGALGLDDAGRNDWFVFESDGGDACEALLELRRGAILAVTRGDEPVLLDDRFGPCFDEHIGERIGPVNSPAHEHQADHPTTTFPPQPAQKVAQDQSRHRPVRSIRHPEAGEAWTLEPVHLDGRLKFVKSGLLAGLGAAHEPGLS